MQLERIRTEYVHNQRQIQAHLEHKKNILTQEKRELYHSEDRLNDRKHSLRREGM